jgi:outer membrane protein assembly factor BamB
MRVNLPRFLTMTMTGGLLLTGLTLGQDWPNWRGPNHDGISPESGFLTRWDAPPKQLWQARIGSAFSAVTCVDGRAYTCGTQDAQQVLFCLDADSGQIIWQSPFEEEYRERQGGDGTRGTPTVHEGHIYLQSARGRLICFDAQTGREVWSRQFNAMPKWGYSGSVLIEGDLAIVIGGDKAGVLVALNKRTGETAWQHGATPVGYSTPLPFTFADRRYIAALLGKSAVIVDARTGREVWIMPWETSWDVNAATPIFHDGHLFLSSGYEHGSAVLKLRPADDSRLTVEKLWSGQAILARFQTPILHDGHLYTCDQVGLKCVHLATGELKWQQGDRRDKQFQNGTVVLSGDTLIILTERGELVLAPATPAGFEPTARAAILDGLCWTVPTLYRGRIYARNLERLVCLELPR